MADMENNAPSTPEGPHTPGGPACGYSGWGRAPRTASEEFGTHRADGPLSGDHAQGGLAGQGAETFGAGGTDDVEPAGAERPDRPEKKRGGRTLGLGSAIAGGLVIALVAGGVGGYFGSQISSSSTTVSSLDRPPVSADSAGGDRPDSTAVEKVAASVLPAVVSIQVVTPNGGGEGSGSIISSDGLVLTNAHVAADGARPGAYMQVTVNNGESHPAELVAADPATDIAVVKIHDVEGLPVMEFGDSNELTVGQPVVAVGSPLGLSSTVTSGIVSALNRPVRASGGGEEHTLIDAVQTDAAINPGNSGGPLVDLNGRLIGMNSVIASLSSGGLGGQQAGSIGLGFAIPSNFAQRVAHQLVEKGAAKQPMLGVQVKPDPRIKGAVVAAVPDGPAKDAGLKEGEVITRVNDRVVDSADALIAAVRTHDFGETVTLEVTAPDGHEPRHVEVTLTDEEG